MGSMTDIYELEQTALALADWFESFLPELEELVDNPEVFEPVTDELIERW